MNERSRGIIIQERETHYFTMTTKTVARERLRIRSSEVAGEQTIGAFKTPLPSYEKTNSHQKHHRLFTRCHDESLLISSSPFFSAINRKRVVVYLRFHIMIELMNSLIEETLLKSDSAAR